MATNMISQTAGFSAVAMEQTGEREGGKSKKGTTLPLLPWRNGIPISASLKVRLINNKQRKISGPHLCGPNS